MALGYAADSTLADEVRASGTQAISLNIGIRPVFTLVWRALRARRVLDRALAEFRPTHTLCSMVHPTDIIFEKVLDRTKAQRALIVHDGEMHPGSAHRWVWPLALRSERRADRLIVLSSHVKDIVCKRRNSGDVIQLWHPPFTPKFIPKTSGRRPGIEFLFFGRIQTYKGLDLLANAGALLKSQGYSFNLVVVGEGAIDSVTLGNLRSCNAAIVNRFVSEREAAEHFKKADIVILPYKEASQSGVVATASAFRVPVLCTPVGGLREQVESLRAGVVCDGVSVEALAAAMRLLIEDNSRIPTATCGDSVDWSEWVRQYIKLVCFV